MTSTPHMQAEMLMIIYWFINSGMTQPNMFFKNPYESESISENIQHHMSLPNLKCNVGL